MTKHSWGSDAESDTIDLDDEFYLNTEFKFMKNNKNNESVNDVGNAERAEREERIDTTHQQDHAISAKITESLASLSDVHYTAGFLYSRIKEINLHLAEKSVDFIVYNSERESFQTMPKYIDRHASQIAITNAKLGHSATYKFSLSISKDEFIQSLLSGQYTHAFFHGVFDGVSCVRIHDSPAKITMQASNAIKNYLNDYFIKNNSHLVITYGYNEFSTKEDIGELQRLVYFSDKYENAYNYSIGKETQINDIVMNNNRRRNNPKNNYQKRGEYNSQRAERPERQDRTDRTDRQDPRNNQQPPQQITQSSAVSQLHKIIPIENRAFVLPVYATPQSIGADVYITHFIKEVSGTQYYGTGYGVCPAPGTYFTLFPRSSLSKKGFFLANSVGLIDPDYQGELIVALHRFDNGNEQIVDMPCAVAQLVTNKTLCPQFEVIEKFEVATIRGTGGFGSTTGELRAPP
jgi:dUTP pyrophosphatase